MAGNRFTQDVQAVKVAVETVAGTFEAPDTVLYLERGASFPSPEFEKVELDPLSATSGGKYSIIVPDNAKINYDVTQKMSQDKAHYLPLLEAANFVGVATTTPAGMAYSLKTVSDKTLSFEWIDPRSTLQGKGAKGAFSLKMEVGKPVDLTFKMLINYHAETVLANTDPDNTVPNATVDGFLYMRKDCGGYTINGVSAHFETVEIDWGVTNVQPNTSCDVANYLSEYAPTIKITQSLTEEGEASFNELKAQTPKVIVLSLYDLAGVKKAEIHIPNAVPSEMTKSGSDGRLKADKTFACRPVVGDDNVEMIIFD